MTRRVRRSASTKLRDLEDEILELESSLELPVSRSAIVRALARSRLEAADRGWRDQTRYWRWRSRWPRWPIGVRARPSGLYLRLGAREWRVVNW